MPTPSRGAGDLIKVDFVVGERDRRPDAMERTYRELKCRVEKHVDARELHYRLPLGLDRQVLVKYPTRATYYAALAKLRRRSDAIVHLHNQKLGQLLHLVDLSPCMVFCHDVIEYVLPEYQSPFLQRAFIGPYHTGTAKADLVVTPSRHTADELKRLFEVPESKLRVIPNGVDRATFRPVDGGVFRRRHSIPEGRPYLLHVGSEQPRKDVPTAVRAFLRARKEIPELMFVKVGRADELPGHAERDKSLRLLDDAGAREAAFFLEKVSDELLASAYSGAAALIFPSLYEGFGLPVVESMACGTPVITTDASSLPEVAGDAAVMVEPRDDEAMAREALRILREPAWRAELSGRGIDRARRFDWDESARKLLDVYRELASA